MSTRGQSLADRIPTKASAGVIVCRKNIQGRLEVLLALKRYTYAFTEFVHGRYLCGGRPAPGIVPAPRAVPELLNDMTTEELLAVWSLDFGQMWYRVWLTCENVELYSRKSAKFHATFMKDHGAQLRAWVAAARPTGRTLWEVPKGRRTSVRESDIVCGLREVDEETGVEGREYRLLPDCETRVSYVSAGTRYTCCYQIAIAYPRLARSEGNCVRWLSEGRPIHMLAEVSEARWFNIERVRLLGDARLTSMAHSAFALVKKYVSGKWAARVHPPRRACQVEASAADPAVVDPAVVDSADPADPTTIDLAGSAGPATTDPTAGIEPAVEYRQNNARSRKPTFRGRWRHHSAEKNVSRDMDGWCTITRGR